ncbi:MAG TPA: toxin-antitoxin system YwqK family antitoxin [Chitinophagaceae bacterium]|nr:toxin-antitoxin system YwqK family antitoxin [Chitinophagaceae bacterium]
MKKPLLLLLLGCMGLQCLSQQDSVRKYLDEAFRFTNKRNAVYAAMAVKSDDHWLLYAVYPDTSTLLKLYYKDADLSVKDGLFILFHPQRVMAQKGFFKDNLPDGQWQSWYPNGQLKNEGMIVKNHLTGVWKSWYSNGQPMNEHSFFYDAAAEGTPVHQYSPAKKLQRVLDDFAPESRLEGRGINWYPNGQKESEVQYHNDTLSGLCTWYRENGSISSQETYVNGLVTELACFDSTGRNTGSACSILKLPVMVHPFFTALDYIEAELHKEKRRGVDEGEAILNFTVTKEGKVTGLRFLDEGNASLHKVIAQIVAGMPAWSPAVSHNRPIDYEMTLQVPYYKD